MHPRITVVSSERDSFKDHHDHSPCSEYCRRISSLLCLLVVLLKNGFGMTSLYVEKEDTLHGSFDGILLGLHLLLNSKAFIEFLCSLRHFIFAFNASKRCYFTIVLSSVLRGLTSSVSLGVDIAMASSSFPSRYACNRFIHYIRKWIPALRQDSVTPSVFVSSLMQCIDKETEAMNRYAFKVWCGHSLLPQAESKDCESVLPISSPSSAASQPLSFSESHNTVYANRSPSHILSSPPHSCAGSRMARHALRPSRRLALGHSRTQRFLCARFSAHRRLLRIVPSLGV